MSYHFKNGQVWPKKADTVYVYRVNDVEILSKYFMTFFMQQTLKTTFLMAHKQKMSETGQFGTNKKQIDIAQSMTVIQLGLFIYNSDLKFPLKLPLSIK